MEQEEAAAYSASKHSAKNWISEMFEKTSPLASLSRPVILIATLLLCSSQANAEIVNLIATGTVSATDRSQFSIGEEVTWTIQYDDTDTTATIYSDGANFTAEGGGGDGDRKNKLRFPYHPY